MNVGILGIGTFLPPDVRTNDWWPRSIVAEWEKRAVLSKERVGGQAPTLRPGERQVLEAMSAYVDDPFRGAVERRVMPAEMKSSDMEIASARQALERSGVATDSIDFVITYSFCPDELLCPNAFVLHEALGLPRHCFTTGVEAACNSFLVALTLAEKLVAGGARNGLVVQSCGISRLLRQEDPTSAWFGDGAASVVVGRSERGGILASATLTDSSLHPAVVTGVPGRAWYEEGRSYFYAKDRASAFRIMAGVADCGKEVIGLALERAGVLPGDVDFFACHQISPWMRKTVQDYCGLTRAKSVETFTWAGNLASVNVPLVLDLGGREGLLREGDRVVLYGGGAGITYSATVLRWGRA